MPFTRLTTRNTDRLGGTILQSTRTNPANTRVSDLPPHLASYGAGHRPDDRVDLTGEVLANLEFLELDGLVVIGGGDTLCYGALFAAKGGPVLGIPQKKDNDRPPTPYYLGLPNPISPAAEVICHISSTPPPPNAS